MADKIVDIKMIGFDKDKSMPDDANDDAIDNANYFDIFSFVMKLSEPAPEEWIKIFIEDLPHFDKNYVNKLSGKITIKDDKLTIKSTAQVVKTVFPDLKTTISCINEKYNSLLDQRRLAKEKNKEVLDDLEKNLSFN